MRPDRPSSPRRPADASGSVMRTVSWSGGAPAAVAVGALPDVGALAGRTACRAHAGSVLASANASMATIRKVPGRCMVAS